MHYNFPSEDRMRYISFSLVFIFLLGLSLRTTGANPVINDADAPRLLYTMSAKSGSMDGDRLTLKDVPLVVYFSDRPHRISGQLSLQVFAQGWDQGNDSFRADPPNATLSIMTEDGVKNAIVELSEPDAKVKEGFISFKVRVLDGEVPKKFGTATLFIDADLGVLGGYTIKGFGKVR